MAVFLAVLGALVTLPTSPSNAGTGWTIAAPRGSLPAGGPLQPIVHVSTTAINFGNIPAGSATPVLAQGSVRVSSSITGIPITIRIGTGQNFSGTERRMKKTVLPLAYQNYRIYKDSAMTQEWGGTGFPRGSALFSTAGTARTVKLFPAYARTLLPHSTVTGMYSDMVQVSVDF